MLNALTNPLNAATSGRTVTYCAQKMAARAWQPPGDGFVAISTSVGERRTEFTFPSPTRLATCAGWAVAGCAGAGPTLVAKGLVGAGQGVGRAGTAILGLLAGVAAAPVGLVSGLFRQAGPKACASQLFETARSFAIRAVGTAGAVLCGVAVGLGELAAALCAAAAFAVFTPVAWLTTNLLAASGLWALALMFIASDRFPWTEPTATDLPQAA